MKLSIIIPLYNKEKFILKLLQKLVINETDDYEVIIIDDRSVDKSFEIAENFIKLNQNKEIKLFQNNINRGVSYTRNRGINKSIGEYVIFLDADDYIEENGIDYILENIKNYDLICLKRRYISKRKIYPNYSFKWNRLKKVTDELWSIEKIYSDLEKRFFLGGSASMIIKRELLKDIQFSIKEEGFEDFEFAIKILKKVKKVYILDKTVVTINDIGESLSRRKRKMENITFPKILLMQDLNKKIYRKLLSIFLFGSYRSLNLEDRKFFINKYKEYINLKECSINKYFICLLIMIFLDKFRRIE